MKVYVLIGSFDEMIEGVYTSEGKKVKEKQLLDKALESRQLHINDIKSMRVKCLELAKQYHKYATVLLHDMAPSEILNFLAIRDVQMARCKKFDKELEAIFGMTTAEILKVYGLPYSWEERELLGN